MKVFTKFTIALMLSITTIANTYAGVVVGGVRVIYDGSKKEASLSVKNPDANPYLIQSWVDSDGPEGIKKSGGKTPFVITPPLFRLDAGKENLLRIVNVERDLPQDIESVYWLNVKSIPSTPKDAENVLQISVKTRIKLFYRPEGIKIKSSDAYKDIIFSREGENLKVTNPSPYYLSFYDLKVGANKIETTNIMVPPKGSALYGVTNPMASGEKITWKYINDFGGSSAGIESILK